MHLVLSILSAGVIVSSLVPNKLGFGQRVGGIIGGSFNKSEAAQLTVTDDENPVKLNKEEKIPRRILIEDDADEVMEDLDFDGDEFDDEDFNGLLSTGSATSLMHIHHEQGEILVPCFGMWWPVGGYNTGGYEYIDYYGDYRKKKRRSKKQKKAAKMKKKRS